MGGSVKVARIMHTSHQPLFPRARRPPASVPNLGKRLLKCVPFARLPASYSASSVTGAVMRLT